MALSPRHYPLTRDQVYGWIQEYVDLDPKKAPPIKQFLAGKLNNLNLPDHFVDTSQHDSLEDTTNILDMIVDDLPSYGYQIS